jgi:hypothetical protein
MSAPPLPFGEGSRTGFELELLAPSGLTRFDFAHALAEELDGRVRYGLKYISEGLYRPRTPICDLTPSAVVEDNKGRALFSLVDDVTIKDNLHGGAPTLPGFFRVVLDDLRMALWLENKALGVEPNPHSLLLPLLYTFDGQILGQGQGEAKHEAHRAVVDPWGNTLAVVALYPGERERVCEVVTAPLSREERREAVELVLGVAKKLDFSIPREAALHLHFDAGPWKESRRLRTLITEVTSLRKLLLKDLQPNPHCTRLGPFDYALVRAAQSHPDDEDFAALCERIEGEKPTKYVDVNILGVIRERPKQPTLEFRCLPMTLDADELFGKVDNVEGLLTDLAELADVI